MAKLEDSSLKTFENDPLKALVVTLEGENLKLKQDITQNLKAMFDLQTELARSQTMASSAG